MIGAFLGLLAGILHVVLGPDHLAALAPLVLDEPGAARRVGLRWGLGHAAGVALVCALVWLLRESLPLESLSGWAERLVGVSLVGLGAWGLLRVLGLRAPRSVPTDGRHAHVALAFGGLHGLAGSAHLLGVLPALALPTRAATLAYLVAFCMGSVCAMVLFSSTLARVAAQRSPRAWQALGASASLIVGAFWLLSTFSTAR